MSKDSKKPVRGRAPKDNGRKFKKKANVLSAEKIEYIDYKDINLLQRFMSDRSKIRGQRLNGNTVQQQRELATAIKNAREMALLPYTKRVTNTRAPRGERRDDDAGESNEQSIEAKYADMAESTLDEGMSPDVETAETVEA